MDGGREGGRGKKDGVMDLGRLRGSDIGREQGMNGGRGKRGSGGVNG
jgi:hypothetical protein